MSTLAKLAKEWNKRFDEDSATARRDLKRHLRENDELLDLVIDEILQLAVGAAINWTPAKKWICRLSLPSGITVDDVMPEIMRAIRMNTK